MAFQGQVAFITGGGSGMGRLATRDLARAGKTIVALDVNEDGLAETAEGFGTRLQPSKPTQCSRRSRSRWRRTDSGSSRAGELRCSEECGVSCPM
ncbi:MAG: SDR family NAD(P)-dependent oxidoreductase [bacterium]|nr:SDR family NAD(P)-dependent oxidoreductase [bacterium]